MTLLEVIVGLAAGAALGAFSLAGLWWTVQRVPSARRPGVLLAVSFALRGAVTLAGFVSLVRLGPWTLLAALLGFAAVRLVTTRLSALGARPGPAQEGGP